MAAFDTDVLVIGAGLVGLSTALQVLRLSPRARVVVIDKDDRVAAQQSGHNSGVVHAGIYYEPGSLKARFCVDGHRELQEFCERHEIMVVPCGKVIVATDRSEVERLKTLYERGRRNGVAGLRLVSGNELTEIEPHVDGLMALHSPRSAIVDYREVAAAYADDFRNAGGELRLGCSFEHSVGTQDRHRVVTSGGEFMSRLVINCAGLHADVIAERMGTKPAVRIIPFRGEYYELVPHRSDLVQGMIYPVPDSRLPFLDVHLTPTVRGVVEAGPNAVLATMREGYSRRDFSLKDFAATVSYTGFWRLAIRYMRPGIAEIHRSLRKSVFTRSLQKLVPEIVEDDLVPGGSGVRAQAVDRNGCLVHDFHVEEAPGAIHVLNAPSPAATSSLPIGRHIAGMAAKRLDHDQAA